MKNNGNNSQRIMCPSCGAEIVVNPTSVIRENTAQLHDLFKGTLNKFQCTKCDGEFLYDAPIVYRDDDHRYVVYYHTSGTNDNLSEALVYMKELYDGLFRDLGDNEKPISRLTLKRKDLVEKIKIHQQGYDDRLIEYIKYQLFQHSDNLDCASQDLLFDFASSNSENLAFLAFDRKTGSAHYSLEFPAEEYEKLNQDFLSTPETAKEFDKLFSGYYVHVGTLLDLPLA
jgi:hypothetical protein